jgi:hypothetical protein
MGRKKKYNTEEEQLEAQRRWNMEYYHRNKEKLKEKGRKRYEQRNSNGEEM